MMFTANSAEWPKQKAALLDRIEEHRNELERATDLGDVRYIQGQIASLRRLIEDVEPDVRQGAGHANYR